MFVRVLNTNILANLIRVKLLKQDWKQNEIKTMKWKIQMKKIHCFPLQPIKLYFKSAFGLNTERYFYIRISPYSFRMQENTGQKISTFYVVSVSCLGSCQTSLTENFANILAVNCFRKNISSYMSDRVQKMHLSLSALGLQKCSFEIIDCMPGESKYHYLPT